MKNKTQTDTMLYRLKKSRLGFKHKNNQRFGHYER